MTPTKPSIPKGTRDFGPEESARRSYIIEIIKASFKKYGFSELNTPAMEQLEVLMGKYGDEGDQLIFKILNSGDFLKTSSQEDFEKGSGHLLSFISEKGLRYDLTVPFARFVVQNRGTLTFPFKRYQIQPVWRADRPQKGRYREFLQCDADIIGTQSLWNEAELTLLIHEVFERLGYTGFLVKINHRRVLNELAQFLGLSGKELPFCITVDKLDKIGKEKVTEELLLLGADHEKLDTVLSLFNEAGDHNQKIRSVKKVTGDHAGCLALEEYFNYLEPLSTNLRVALDFSLARGLNYYTGMIFEVVATDVKIGSMSGGGRYDDLTGVFGMEGISGVGISFGLDRIYDVLEERHLFPQDLVKSSDLLIAHLDEKSFIHGTRLLTRLREKEIKAIIYPEPAKIKKQFNYGDKLKVSHVLVIGTEEMKQEKYTLKNMKTGEQTLVTIEELLKLFTH